jgi:hypothetical protein
VYGHVTDRYIFIPDRACSPIGVAASAHLIQPWLTKVVTNVSPWLKEVETNAVPEESGTSPSVLPHHGWLEVPLRTTTNITKRSHPSCHIDRQRRKEAHGERGNSLLKTTVKPCAASARAHGGSARSSPPRSCFCSRPQPHRVITQHNKPLLGKAP